MYYYRKVAPLYKIFPSYRIRSLDPAPQFTLNLPKFTLLKLMSSCRGIMGEMSLHSLKSIRAVM